MDFGQFFYPKNLIITFKFISKNHCKAPEKILTTLHSLVQLVITAHIHWRRQKHSSPCYTVKYTGGSVKQNLPQNKLSCTWTYYPYRSETPTALKLL